MAGGRTSERVRQTLVVAQVALTIVLLAGAGLLARSFVNVLAVDPGFRTDKRLARSRRSGRSRAILQCSSGARRCSRSCCRARRAAGGASASA